MNGKITEQHQSKPAYVYVRQSTLGKYVIIRRAPSASTRCDRRRWNWAGAKRDPHSRPGPGNSAQLTGREDFKTLVADVSMGQVGRCLPWKCRDWPDRTSTGTACCNYARSPNVGHRWGWLLRPCGLQRRTVARAQGHHGASRVALLARPPPGRQAEQGQEGELRVPLPVGLCYDAQGRCSWIRMKKYVAPWPGLSAVPGNRQRPRGDAMVRRHQSAFPSAAMVACGTASSIGGTSDLRPDVGYLKNPSYAGDVCLWPISISAGDHARRGGALSECKRSERSHWRVSLVEHHDGYVGWEEF